MFFLLSKILDFFVTPLAWIIISLLIAVFAGNPVKRKKWLIISFLMLLFFTNPFIIGKVMDSWEISTRPATELTSPYDVGIVMGGSMRYFDAQAARVVYSSSVDRMLQALQLYHDGHIRKIMLTGGSGFVNFQDWKESGLIANVLLKSGVKPEDIILENNSRNTYENAVFSAKILSSGKYGQKFLLITSASHMRRSMACFEKAGIQTVPFSADPRSGSGIRTLDKYIQPEAENMVTWDTLLHEWVGVVMYRLMGYL